MDQIDQTNMDERRFRPHVTVDQLPPPNTQHWKLIECNSDGNCFYHAISKHLRKSQSPFDIRCALILYIEKTKYRLPNLNDVVNRIIVGINDHLMNVPMSSDGWANHEEIQLCARMFNMIICVWNAEFGMWTACFPCDDMVLLSDCKRVVYLHNDGCHFRVLKRKR